MGLVKWVYYPAPHNQTFLHNGKSTFIRLCVCYFSYRKHLDLPNCKYLWSNVPWQWCRVRVRNRTLLFALPTDAKHQMEVASYSKARTRRSIVINCILKQKKIHKLFIINFQYPFHGSTIQFFPEKTCFTWRQNNPFIKKKCTDVRSEFGERTNRVRSRI